MKRRLKISQNSKKHRKRASIGDVMKMKTEKWVAYLQYLCRTKPFGQVVLVSPKYVQELEEISPETFEGGFIIFFPVNVYLSEGRLEWIGKMALVKECPPYWRHGQHEILRDIGITKNILWWTIYPRYDDESDRDESVHIKKYPDELNEEELHYPIPSLVDYFYLKSLIEKGWKPWKVINCEDEGFE